MTQYILMRFEDDEVAQQIVDAQKMDADSKGDWDGVIVGQYKIPTLFCECSTAKAQDPHNRGAKYGWFLCPDCAKPRRYHGQTPINILDPEVEAQDPHYKDHVLHIYPEQNVGKTRRKKAIALINQNGQRVD